MRTPILTLMASAGTLFLPLGEACAAPIETTVLTEPLGSMTLTLPAGQTRPISIPLKVSPVYTGTVDALVNEKIRTFNAGWPANAFVPVKDRPHLLRFLNGAYEGRYYRINNQTTDTLTLNQPSGPLRDIQVGDEYEIAPIDTLQSLFGNKVLSHTDPRQADNVLLLEKNRWITFYHTGKQWAQEKSPNVSENQKMVYPDQGMLFVRRGRTALTLTFAGTFPHDPHVTHLPDRKSTLLANPFPMDVRLNDLDLHTDPAWKTGTHPASVDCVQLYGRQGWETYTFHRTGWLKDGRGAAQNPVVPRGSALVVIRQKGKDAWMIPLLP